jgi:RNA-directed DNA polymerase
MEIARVQKSLATKALSQATHRFDDLYRYVRDVNWLESARSAIMSNNGAKTPGVDGINGQELPVSEWLALLNQTIEELREGTYRPMPVRRIYIPKANGKLRPLGIPTIRDRMVQEALRMVMEPIYESQFLPCSNGFRPGRSTMTASNHIQRLCNEKGKYFWIVEGDIKGCFDNISHEKLIHVLRKRIADERLLSLIWAFLKAGYMEEGKLHAPKVGTPQGGIASPLLANVYLHEMDLHWQERYNSMSTRQRERRRKEGKGNVQLVRYADDFLVLTNGPKAEAEALKEEFGDFLQHLELTLSPEKTVITHVNDGFDVLGFHIQRRPKLSERERKVLYVTPTEKSVERYKEKIRDLLTEPNINVVNKLQAVNRVIRGWARYYQYVQSSWVRQKLDHWTYEAFWKWLHRKKHGGYVGKKELYDKYLTQRNYKGQKTLGYGQVFLARMNDIAFKQYYSPKGGVPNPYLTDDADLTIAEENPIAQETWNGTSAQNKYAIARQDLRVRLGPTCQMCKQAFLPERLQAHHIQSQKEGGKHGTSNLRLLCHDCHTTTENYGTSRKI